MFVNGPARSEALAHVTSADWFTLDAPPSPLPDTQEAIDAYLATVKPKHYAALALLIDAQLDATFQQIGDRPPDGLLPSPSPDNDASPFRRLRVDFLHTLQHDLERLRTHPLFQKTARLTYATGNLGGDRHIDLDLQLDAGVNTAVSSMVKILESVPTIVDYLGPKPDKSSYGNIARRSVGLPWNMAMMCIEKMMSLRGLAAHRSGDVFWAISGTVLDPTFFEPVRQDAKIVALKFTDLDSVVAPEGYSLHPFIPPLAAATKLGDIACHQEVTIGCPITLLHQRLHNLWNWLIDTVERRELWTKASG
ncbi:MAG TPA: hypothetical protein VLG37_02855 [Candidatus Saccharimonadales bacterium]|nr:hypothetical protein [Candidatus Saccharimonadales bacterium]